MCSFQNKHSAARRRGEVVHIRLRIIPVLYLDVEIGSGPLHIRIGAFSIFHTAVAVRIRASDHSDYRPSGIQPPPKAHYRRLVVHLDSRRIVRQGNWKSEPCIIELIKRNLYIERSGIVVGRNIYVSNHRKGLRRAYGYSLRTRIGQIKI